MNFNIQTVMVAPLDWGLGHATRCIPLIRALMNGGYTVLIACEGSQKVLLQQEFPQLQFIHLAGYHVHYSKNKWLLPFVLTAQLPKIKTAIRDEHEWLEKIIEEEKIDLVISDNRFGLWAKKNPCIFITHQLQIKAPFRWLERWLQKINYKYIDRFSVCWVPDSAGKENAAGSLSHPSILPSTPVYYMNLLSRFIQKGADKKYDCCIVLSGPEPQRTILEEKIIAQAMLCTEKLLLVRGKPESIEKHEIKGKIEICDHLAGIELQRAFEQSDYIISRSGYTTVMELLSLQKKSILIPTPGQTEQEYLAARLMKQQYAYSVSQENFDLASAIAAAKKFSYKTISLPVFNKEKMDELLALVATRKNNAS